MVVKIMGGLGNQMFQYAYGRSLEKKGKQVIFDTSFFYGHKASGDTARSFMLDRFVLNPQVKFSPKKHHLHDLLVKIKRALGFELPHDYPSDIYMWDIAGNLKKEFILKEGLGAGAKEVLEKIKNSRAVSLHVRRGDYVANPKIMAYHGICGVEYYRRAIRIIKEKINNPTFFIFSDDIEWAKENFKGDEYFFVSNSNIKETEDLMLMSFCRHQIIANSSFSWWGAWLNKNPDKIVIAPRRWLNIKKDIADKVLPKNWIKI